MGRRPDRSLGALVRCRLAAVFYLCVCLLLLPMASTGVANSGPNAAAPAGGRIAGLTTGSQAGADAFRGSKRRIPKGPDPIHNRRVGKTTIAPRRRD